MNWKDGNPSCHGIWWLDINGKAVEARYDVDGWWSMDGKPLQVDHARHHAYESGVIPPPPIPAPDGWEWRGLELRQSDGPSPDDVVKIGDTGDSLEIGCPGGWAWAPLGAVLAVLRANGVIE